jgi:hypothetical protein
VRFAYTCRDWAPVHGDVGAPVGFVRTQGNRTPRGTRGGDTRTPTATTTTTATSRRAPPSTADRTENRAGIPNAEAELPSAPTSTPPRSSFEPSMDQRRSQRSALTIDARWGSESAPARLDRAHLRRPNPPVQRLLKDRPTRLTFAALGLPARTPNSPPEAVRFASEECV